MLERTALEGGVNAILSRSLLAEGFLVAFTERERGVSTGPFRSLNVGFGCGDDPGRVMENRRIVSEALEVDRFACAAQVHGGRCVRIGPKRAGSGYEDAAGAVPGADALATSTKKLPISVMAADCVPVALADPSTGTIAVVHAGWRGLPAGILQGTLRAFGRPSNVHGVIGPAIGADHYDVKEDVALAVAASSQAGALTRKQGSRIFLDLPGTVARVLRELGVKRIDRADVCTACEPARFFSHRRDGTTGRQALIAARL